MTVYKFGVQINAPIMLLLQQQMSLPKIKLNDSFFNKKGYAKVYKNEKL